MYDLNQVILEGNVVRDPEIMVSKNGAMLCRLSVAVNRSYRGREGATVNDVSYFDVVSFGDTAEKCRAACTKGKGVRVLGSLHQDRYKDKDGKKRSQVQIIARRVELRSPFAETGSPFFVSAERVARVAGTPPGAASERAPLTLAQMPAAMQETFLRVSSAIYDEMQAGETPEI